MQILLRVVLVVLFILSLVIAVPYMIVVPPLILIFWAKPKLRDEPATTISAYASLCVGAFVGFYLLIVLFVACNIPHHREVKRTFQKWSGHDREFEVIES